MNIRLYLFDVCVCGVRASVYARVCVRACAGHVCVCVCVCGVCVCVLSACVCVWARACVNVRMCVSECVYIYKYTHT